MIEGLLWLILGQLNEMAGHSLLAVGCSWVAVFIMFLATVKTFIRNKE